MDIDDSIIEIAAPSETRIAFNKFDGGLAVEHDQVARVMHHRVRHTDGDVQQLDPATFTSLLVHMDHNTVRHQCIVECKEEAV